jgi:hypothetical protein
VRFVLAAAVTPVDPVVVTVAVNVPNNELSRNRLDDDV